MGDRFDCASRITAALIFFSAFLFAGCNENGPQRHPFEGVVKVNGQPAERVLVQLTLQNAPEARGNDRYPSSLTDSQGRFAIGKGSGNVGAIEGEYSITFSWLSSPDLDAIDKLKGAYGSAENSKFKIRVPRSEKELLEFDLKPPR